MTMLTGVMIGTMGSLKRPHFPPRNQAKNWRRKKEETTIIVEDNPANMSAFSFTETQDNNGWGDDWNTPATKTVTSAAQKKAEREARIKARKAEMEKKRAAKKTTTNK